jgi:hypothetical protein
MAAMQGLWAAVLAGLTVGAVVAPKAPDAKQQALRIFGLRYPEVRWQLERPLAADFTGDGEADLALQGARGRDFAVGVIVGPIGPLSTTLSMVWPAAANPTSSDCVNNAAPLLITEGVSLPPGLWGCPGEQAAAEFCASVGELEAWIRDAAARGVQGLRVTGDSCDELHLYWNPQSQQFDHWRASDSGERGRPTIGVKLIAPVLCGPQEMMPAPSHSVGSGRQAPVTSGRRALASGAPPPRRPPAFGCTS